MTIEQLKGLKKDVATLFEDRSLHFEKLARIVSGTPALIALAEWAMVHGIVALKDWRHADGCFCEASFAGPPGCHPSHSDECKRAMAAITAYHSLS